MCHLASWPGPYLVHELHRIAIILHPVKAQQEALMADEAGGEGLDQGDPAEAALQDVHHAHCEGG